MKLKLFSHLTIRQKLPLFVCALLFTVTLSFGILCYLGVQKAALKTGHDRLQTLSYHLSDIFASQANAASITFYEKANKPAVSAFFRSKGRDSAATVSRWLSEQRKDSNTIVVDLWGLDHQRLASSRPFLKTGIGIDSLLVKTKEYLIGKFYFINGTIAYPVIAEVKDSSGLAGYCVRWRLLRSNPQSVERLTNLMGSDVQIYIGNSDSSVWTDLVKSIELPKEKKRTKSTVVEYQRSDSRWLASIRPVAGSPWLVAVEIPKEQVLQTASIFLYWLIIGGSILIALGIVCGWIMGRNLSEPIVKLTAAANEMASGNYSSHVPINRKDEVGMLARSFNAMSAQVRTSRKDLLDNVKTYRLLFDNNPMPMWIMSPDTLDLLEVNEAALRHYGYTKEEFLKLNAVNLRPEEDISKFLSEVPKHLKKNKNHGIWRHKKKDGTMIIVEMITDTIHYKNQIAILVLANDNTEKLKAEAELVQNRIKQQELITETTIMAQEKEREEIGKELHDNINQILASSKLYLELARSSNDALLHGAVEKSYEHINLAMSEIRHLSKQLVKPSFSSSLKDSLIDLTNELRVITPVNMTLDASEFDEGWVDENTKLMIYRVAQEQLNNILKHAKASAVTITIKTTSGNLEFHIKDDGVGFDVNKKARGIGLRNINNRVEFYKGNLKIESAPGEGCTLAIQIPLKHQFDTCQPAE